MRPVKNTNSGEIQKMFTMTIHGDPKKIAKDGRYTINEYNALIRQICTETRFQEKSFGEYYLDEQEDELGRMIVLATKIDKLNIEGLLKIWTTRSDYEGKINQLK